MCKALSHGVTVVPLAGLPQRKATQPFWSRFRFQGSLTTGAEQTHPGM